MWSEVALGSRPTMIMHFISPQYKCAPIMTCKFIGHCCVWSIAYIIILLNSINLFIWFNCGRIRNMAFASIEQSLLNTVLLKDALSCLLEFYKYNLFLFFPNSNWAHLIANQSSRTLREDVLETLCNIK